MSTCCSCKIEIADGVPFCPRCGQPTSAAQPEDVDSLIHRLLTEAHLLKTRGDYNAAIDKCTEALQLQAMDPSIHALLGDIYEQQGNIAEAVKWYQMAYELRPNSSTDRSKLQKAEARLAKQKHKDQELTTGYWLQPTNKIDVTIRYIVIFCVIAVLLLLIVGMVGWIARPHTQQDANIGPSGTGAIGSRNPGLLQPQTPINGALPTLPAPETLVRPVGEQQLLSNLATNPAIMQQKIVVEDVKIDPRSKRLLVTFRSSGSPNSFTRLTVLRNAAYVAAAAFAANPDSTVVTVRGLIILPGKLASSEPHLVLISDVHRGVSGMNIISATTEQLQQVFTDEWWGPELTQ